MLISIKDLQEIVDVLASKLEGVVEEAYVFGSIVEGCAIPGESDLDLLIMPKSNKKEDYFTLLDEVVERLLDLGLVLHIHIADNPSYGNLLRSAKEEGVKIV